MKRVAVVAVMVLSALSGFATGAIIAGTNGGCAVQQVTGHQDTTVVNNGDESYLWMPGATGLQPFTCQSGVLESYSRPIVSKGHTTPQWLQVLPVPKAVARELHTGKNAVMLVGPNETVILTKGGRVIQS